MSLPKFCNEWITIRTKHFLCCNLFIIYIKKNKHLIFSVQQEWLTMRTGRTNKMTRNRFPVQKKMLESWNMRDADWTYRFLHMWNINIEFYLIRLSHKILSIYVINNILTPLLPRAFAFLSDFLDTHAKSTSQHWYLDKPNRFILHVTLMRIYNHWILIMYSIIICYSFSNPTVHRKKPKYPKPQSWILWSAKTSDLLALYMCCVF